MRLVAYIVPFQKSLTSLLFSNIIAVNFAQQFLSFLNPVFDPFMGLREYLLCFMNNQINRGEPLTHVKTL